MNTIFKRSFFAVASLFSIFLVCSSCEDNIGIKVTEEAPNADKTLYEVIMNDPELTDFVEVLNACNVRSEKNPDEIISVADSLFNTSKVYTVWAPKNGSFVKEDILARIKDGYRDDVMKTFVFSHVANYLKAAKGRYDEDGELILMLNDKKSVFAGSYDHGYTFAGKELIEVNNRVKNGILHKLSSASEYNYNIWEYIHVYSQNKLHNVDSLVNYLYSFNDTIFDEYESNPGPIVNGVETYLDSAFRYENKLLSKYGGGVGNIDNEDSIYTFYLPTNDVWDNMIAKAEKHFNYTLKSPNSNIKVDTALIDSLRHYYPRHNIIKYLTYSDIEQRHVKHPEDTVMPVQYGYPRKLFARSVFNERAVVETKVLSNGTVKVINEFPYSMFDLWHDTIRIEAEDMGLLNLEETENEKEWIKRYNVSDKTINKAAGTKISGQYINFGDDNNSQTKLCYYIPGVKSATYQVALIFVPRNITNKNVDVSKDKPYRIRCTVKQYMPDLNSIESVAPAEVLQPRTDVIDTVYLKKPMTFPICEYNIATKVENYTAKIYLEGYNKGNNAKKYDNTIRLDAILLIPEEDAE